MEQLRARLPEKVYIFLSRALANGNLGYTESNNVSIQMSTKLSSVSFTLDVNDPSKEVQLGQVDTVVGKPNGNCSYDPDRRIKELEDADRTDQ